LKALSAARGPIGLAHHRNNLVGRINQTLKMSGGEVRGAREYHFKRCRHRSVAAFLFFDELAANALSLQWRQVVDEQLAFKMVYLVLQTNTHEAI
jgi:hypothetical protein